jgi:hypothetical protein
MIVEVLGWTRHGSLATSSYMISDETFGNTEAADATTVEAWLAQHALDFWKILDFRFEWGPLVVDWARSSTAEEFLRITNPPLVMA